MKLIDKIQKYNDLSVQLFEIERELTDYCINKIRKIGVREFARKIKYSPSYISDIVNRKRYFPDIFYKHFIEESEVK